MTHTANARFAIKSWDEKPYSEGQDLPKMTRASVTKTFTGDIAGDSQVEYLMIYRSDGTATFVGLERITGRIGNRTGSFVLQRTGAFEGGQAKESYSVVPGRIKTIWTISFLVAEFARIPKLQPRTEVLRLQLRLQLHRC